MPTKSEKVEMNKEEIQDDISAEANVNQDKLSQLKAKLAKKETDKLKNDRALKFGVIGLGQGGSNIAVEFFKSPNSYPTLIFNTAKQDLDLLDIPETNKIHWDIGTQGCAKDQSIGKEVAEVYRDTISTAAKRQLGDAQAFLVCSSFGGGTGSGSLETVVDILNETGKPILILGLLPMTSEDASIKSNSVNTMETVSQMLKDGRVANLILVDGAKIEEMHSNVSFMKIFDVSNKEIVEPLCEINKLCTMASKAGTFDNAEFIRLLLEGKGCISYSKIEMSLDTTDTLSIAMEIERSLVKNLLSNLDISTAEFAGVAIAASESTWDKIPAAHINYAQAQFTEKCNGSKAVFKGNYIDESIEEDKIIIYSIFSGMNMPKQRLDDLRTEVAHMSELTKQKENEKAKVLEQTSNNKEKHISKIEEIKQRIAKSNSSFSKFMSNNTIDRRKK